MKIDADEKELLESVERGEWKSAGGGKRERARFSRYAKATFKKDRRLNIRLSSKDLEAIQKRALAEGLAVSDADREPAAQVRGRPPQRDLRSGRVLRAGAVPGGATGICPTSMRPVVTFAYVTGWRINSEVLPLQWRQVDLRVGRGPAGSRHDEEPRGSRLLPDVRTEGAAEGATQGRRSDSASEGHDRPARVLPRRAHQERRRRVLVRACDRAQRLLPCLVPRPDRRRLPRQHPARLPSNRHPEHGPRRHSRTRRDEIERPQDAQRLRSL